MLASINGVDITKYILASSYTVNSEEIYNEWEDGWKVKHRDIIRERVAGEFSLKFKKGTTDYADFVSLIESVAVNRILPITVYVANKNIEKTIDVYFSFAPTVRKNIGMKIYDQFNFVLEER